MRLVRLVRLHEYANPQNSFFCVHCTVWFRMQPQTARALLLRQQSHARLEHGESTSPRVSRASGCAVPSRMRHTHNFADGAGLAGVSSHTFDALRLHLGHGNCHTPKGFPTSRSNETLESRDAGPPPSLPTTDSTDHNQHDHWNPPGVSSVSFSNSIPENAVPAARCSPVLDDTTSFDSLQEESVPDRGELRDQLEWDLGVEETLYSLKKLQIKEQIAMEGRQHGVSKRNRIWTFLLWFVPPYFRRKRRAAFSEASRSRAKTSITNDVNERRRSTCGPQGPLIGPERSGPNASLRKAGIDYRFGDDMRSKSKRALFEGLANTADMSRDRWYIVRSDGRMRTIWTCTFGISTLVTATLTPLITCHFIALTPATYFIEAVCDLCFAADVILTFLTAYQDEVRDIIVTSPRHIRMRYMGGRFPLDAFIGVPFDHIFEACSLDTVSAIARMCKVLRMYRLLFSSDGVASHLGDTSFNPSLLLLIKLTSALFLVWHWTACLYSLISSISIIETLSTPGVFYYETGRPWTPSSDIMNGPPYIRYLHSMSWAIGATCMIFRPDPNTLPQLVFSDIITVVGFITMAGIVGAATTAIGEFQAQRSETSRFLQSIARYMRRKYVPYHIRRRVLSYYRFQQSSMNILESEAILVGLPRALRVQISLIMHKPIFVQLPLFWLCTEEEMLLIVQRLRPCLVMPGEMLVRENTFGVGLFLLMKGAVEITQNGDLLVVLLATAAFGETALRADPMASNVTVRALRFCETTILMREDWASIEQLNPQIKTWLEVYIIERDRKLKDKMVQAQSQQTKKATMRCGGSYNEWTSETVKPDQGPLPTRAFKAACQKTAVSLAFASHTGFKIRKRTMSRYSKRTSTPGDQTNGTPQTPTTLDSNTPREAHTLDGMNHSRTSQLEHCEV